MDYSPYPPDFGRDATWGALDGSAGKLANLDDLRARLGTLRVFVGLDGYVDSLYALVKKRESVEQFEIMESMVAFSRKAMDTAGSSCNIERILKKQLGGGFGPNTARAVASLGIDVDLVGALGSPRDIFTATLPGNVNFHSIGEPGETCALEFNDGKIMLTDFGNVNNITWDLIKKKLGREAVIDLMEKSDAIGQGHWALVPHMNETWKGWIDEVFPSLGSKERIFFVDPADMSKRPHQHVRDMVGYMEQLGTFKGVKPVMSINDKEVIQITRCFDELDEITSFTDYYTIGEKMMELFDINSIIIHHPHFATISTKDDSWFVKEGFTSKPRFTTAAGDHFNGGIIMGLASGMFDPGEVLVIANACTAHFVRTGNSPSLDDLQKFVNHYREYVENDVDTIIP
ncbi:MAG: hypothetical protein ACTSUE_17145 [Promethearchaeota archaeon]